MNDDDFVYTKFNSIHTRLMTEYTFKPAGFIRVQRSLFCKDHYDDNNSQIENSGIFFGKVYEVYEQINTYSDICYFIVSPYTKDGIESKTKEPFGLSGYYTENGNMITWFNEEEYLSHVLPKEQWLKYILLKGTKEDV